MAQSPGLSYPITYTGQTDRLALKYGTGTPSDLELLFKLTAHKHGAMLAVSSKGEYLHRAGILGW